MRLLKLYVYTGVILLLHCFCWYVRVVLVISYTHSFAAIPVLAVGVCRLDLSEPTDHVMHQQFNIQQLCVLPTLYLCVLYLSENKERIVPLTALTDWFL